MESLSCPNCGAPLVIPQRATVAVCTYCCASVGIKADSLGHRQIVLEEIRDGTDLVAMRAAREHLSGQLPGLMQAWSEQAEAIKHVLKLKAQRESIVRQDKFWRWPALVVGSVLIILGILSAFAGSSDPSICFGMGFFVLLAALVLWLDVGRHARVVNALDGRLHTCGEHLARLGQEIGAIEERIGDLGSRMDHLAREI